MTTAATRCRAALLATAMLLAGPFAHADQQEPWQFTVTPYLWLPSINASLGFETGGSGGSSVDMSDVLKHLSGAFFLNAAARQGQWGASFDVVYCDFTKTGSHVTNIDVPGQGGEVPINAGTKTGLTGYMFTLAGTYNLQHTAQATFDLLGGVRYTHIGATLDWSFTNPVPALPGREGSAELGPDLWDGIIGVRGSVALGSSPWYVPLYLDAGSGTSQFTWQAMAGLGYRFSWGDLLLVYRHLAFEGSSGDDVQHLALSGFALGATFRF